MDFFEISKWNLLGVAVLALVSSACAIDYETAPLNYSNIVLPNCEAPSQRNSSAWGKIDTSYSSCTYHFNEGGVAHPRGDIFEVLGELHLPFGKDMDFSHLDAVLEASAQNTWVYIEENFPVEVYAVPPASYQSCQLFQELPLAPQELQCAFDIQQNQLNTHAHGPVSYDQGVPVLQGLYWVAGAIDRTSLGYRHLRSVIYVRSDSNRWTLVHEFMHHLFHERRASLGLYMNVAEDLNKTLVELSAKEQELKTSPQKRAELINLLERSADLQVEDLLQRELEEVTIEYILLQLFQSRYFSHTDDNSRASTSYIAQSLQAAEFKIDAFLNRIDRIENHLSSQKALTTQENSRIETSKSKLNNLKVEMNSIRERLPSFRGRIS